MHTLTSFDGVVFADIDWQAGFPIDAQRGQWMVGSGITPRAGGTSYLTDGPISPRQIVVDFLYVGAGDTRDAIDELIGALNPRDQSLRLLVGARYDATVVARYAKVDLPSGGDPESNVNVVRAIFLSEDPEWVRTTTETETASDTTSPFELALENEGHATVAPRYRIAWDTQRATFGEVVGQQYRKRVTITNTQDRTLAPFPYLVPLGDTAGLVSGSKAQSDGDDLIVTINGESVPRLLVGWNKPYMSGAWIVVPGMDAGEELAIDVYYGNADATNPPAWVDPDPDKPILDMYSESGTATGGSTTTVVKAGAGWDTNRFHRGFVTMLTGTGSNIGVTRQIDTNTSTTITTFTAFPAAVASSDTFVITMSSNARWLYATRQADRDTEYFRGRFYVDGAERPPSVVSYESPGSWRPELVWDNRDSYGIERFTRVDVGGGDRDTFALLDAARTWAGNDERVPQAGTADGMSLTTPVPIESLVWEYSRSIPNGMVQVYVGVRASGAEEWAEAYSDDTATAGLVGISPVTVDVQSDFGDVYQIVTALGPANGIEIGTDWKRIEGSLTSGSTTTSTDAMLALETDQFDGGVIRMYSGLNDGRKRAISANTGTQFTHSAFPSANADGDRYVVTNPLLTGELIDGDILIVNLDDSAIATSGLGAEADVYELAATLWVGAGPSGDPAGQHRALIGWAAGEKRTFLAADESLEIDAEARRVRIVETATGDERRTLTDPEVIVQYHDGERWRRSASWLPLGTGEQSAWIEETDMGELTLEVVYAPSYLGA